MAEDFGKQLGRFFKGIQEKTSETFARQEAAFARGKVAGTAVHSDDGTLIIDAGHLIDEAVLANAERAGKLGAVAVSAGTAQMQDLKEKATDTLANTQNGREARSLDSVEEFQEALAYVGRYTGVDVTDIRGNIIIPAGKKIDPEDVRAAREEQLLSALIYSAQQGHAPAPGSSGPIAEPSTSPGLGYPATTPTPKRAALPVVGPNAKPK